jgi:threonylcarbamoyladenosine tRNA methylthiotransferase MtaB
MKKAAFYTLGCKVNQYETEAMSCLFEKEGYEIVDFNSKADVYVINTCTVTGLSARKSRQMARRAKSKNKNSIVVVAGCYSQTAPGEVSKIPGVDLIIGTNDRNNITSYIKQVESRKTQLTVVDDIMGIREFEEMKVDRYKGHTRAFLKIQEGCSQFCTYCIIPYARGPIRSRKPENIINEVKKLADGGFKEIVLTGIHIASYGRERGDTSLLEIIEEIHDIEGIERIRLGSIEPTTITNDFAAAVKGLHKLCPHYHVSLQSGCDEVLKRMNRRYTTNEYKKSVELLIENVPDVALTTDIMVGFPGETDEEFEETYRFAYSIPFSKMHIFKYSPRKGTPAASFKGQVSPEVKEIRSRRLIDLSDEKILEFNRRYEGRVVKVLFEQEVKTMNNHIEGLTPNYIRTVCKGDKELLGRIADVKICKAREDYVFGGGVNTAVPLTPRSLCT